MNDTHDHEDSEESRLKRHLGPFYVLVVGAGMRGTAAGNSGLPKVDDLHTNPKVSTHTKKLKFLESVIRLYNVLTHSLELVFWESLPRVWPEIGSPVGTIRKPDLKFVEALSCIIESFTLQDLEWKPTTYGAYGKFSTYHDVSIPNFTSYFQLLGKTCM